MKHLMAFVDCEFNGFGGELISMAIVCSDGREWYQVREIPICVDPWVAEHVIPVLRKEPVGPDVFLASFHHFMTAARPFCVVADWPADLVHFFTLMLGERHDECLQLRVTAYCDPTLQYVSAAPHNALEDARALRAAWEFRSTPFPRRDT